MLSPKSWVVLATLAAFATHAAVIYKWTDEKGVVHYSDQPQPGAEKIVTAGQSTSSGVTTGLKTAPGAEKKPTGPSASVSVSIISPTPEQSFFGDEQITARALVQPEPSADQKLSWSLNGRVLEEGANAAQFALPHLDRGTYSLTVTLTDQETGASQGSSGVTFYVRQPSLLSPARKHP